MAKVGKRKPSRFWLKLVAGYVILIILWPFVRSPYDRMLGRLSAVHIPALAVERTDVRRIDVTEELWFFLTVYSASQQKMSNVDYHIDAHQYGYGHIIFTVLAFTVPGWRWRQRLARWAIGTAALQLFFVFMVLLNLFSVVANQGLETWRGDVLTRIIPATLFLQHRGFIALVSANLMPAVAWLGLFAFPLFKFNAKDGSVAAFRDDGFHARVGQPKG